MAEHQKYKITERIDAGGMAEVFRGIAEGLQGFKKSVAIKRILPHLCKNKKFISMFLDEAKLSLHLQHANIVGVFDIGVSPAGPDGEGGAYFIVMEFVDGSHLKGIVESMRRQGKSLSVAQVLYIVMQVCNGLAYAHEITDPETGRPLGIVHRDISPPNILISKQGEVKLVDFGLAKATSQIETTDPGVVKGKFSYLSPEAANGKEVDKRADIFAVGILLYEMLTGKRLFYGENDYQTVEMVRQARVPSISQQNSLVEPELEAIVRKSLARDVNARYQTAGELGDAIAQHLFSRGLKVTQRDIGALVTVCVAERQKSSATQPKQKSLIDTLILEELNKFTSLEEADTTAETTGPGARPLSPEELSGAKPRVSGGDLIDTSAWTQELTGEFPKVEKKKAAPPPPVAERTNGQPAAQSWAASTTSQPGQTAPPPPRPGPPPPRPPVAPMKPARPDPSDVQPLEHLLEGDEGGKAQANTTTQPPAKAGPMAAILVAVVALLLVGGTTVLWFVKTHVAH